MLDATSPRKSLRFSVRTAILCTTLIALAVGWYTSVSLERNRNARLAQQLVAAKSQIRLVEARVKFHTNATPSRDLKMKGVLSQEKLAGVNLRGVILRSDDGAFLQTVFDKSDLTNASLTGGHASFQGASFNNALLRNAKLIGGASSIQFATFVNADLSGALLSGNLQVVSLANAKCVGATIKGSFQGVNIDAAQFQSADLSAISPNSLESCFFENPPIYDSNTMFPEGFNPHANGWKKFGESGK